FGFCCRAAPQVHRKRHAVTLTTDEGVEILIHVGIETVGLDGQGFQVWVSDGERMSKGDLLVEFDVDMIARTAKSLIHRCPGRERQFLSPGKSIQYS
ncbi:MAG: PTS glucose transporter subunit IIA, partial [Terrimicrobiaceae bacterium]